MTPPAQQYADICSQLHGKLSEAERERLLERGDVLWERMSADERVALDVRLRAEDAEVTS